MKLKKAAALICAVTMVCAALTACNNTSVQETENGTETNTVTHTEPSTDAETQTSTKESKEETTMLIFSGECKIDAPWTSGTTIYTTNAENGTFDASTIAEGGCLAVTYTGTRAQVYLAFQDNVNWTWKSVNTPSVTDKTEDGFVSYFSFADCAAAYGSNDFSDLGSFTVGTTQSTETVVITSIAWGKMPTAKDMPVTSVDLSNAETLFSGSATANTTGTNLTFFYTKHVGGAWDAAAINKGSAIYVEYSGEKDGIYLAFASASGATSWVAVYPDDTGKNAQGNYYSLFSYDTFAKAFGTNFARLDQIQAYCAKDASVTLKKIAYIPGTGAAVDTSEGTWDRPDTGIAFIGDSIVQNPLVDTTHLGGLDWNGIFGKDNCANYGIGGQTTKECVARINELAQRRYDKTVMLCGINDIGRNLTNAQIVSNYQTMTDTLLAGNPSMEIFIISVLPTTPVFYTNQQDRIVSLNKDLKSFAEANANITFIDVHSSFVGEDGYCKDGLTFDGLHPNLYGYMVLADIVGPYLYENYTSNNLIIDNSHIADATYAETVLYSGEHSIAASWTMGPVAYTKKAGGSVDPSVITGEGYFIVEYTGTAEKVYLAFQDATNWAWMSVNMPTYTEVTEHGCVSYFSIADCIKVYGTENFSDLGAVIVGTTDSTETVTITKLTWGAVTE